MFLPLNFIISLIHSNIKVINLKFKHENVHCGMFCISKAETTHIGTVYS